MNVLEAFFITLGFDTSEFDKKRQGVDTSLTKLGETSDKQTKIIAESGKKAAHTFSLLKVEVLGALAAFGMSTGFKDFVKSNVEGNAALGRTARNLNMSAAELKAWGFAAEGMGGKADDATSALSALAKGLADAKIHGTSPLIQASRRFGFQVSQDPEQTMVNISRRMAETHDRQQAMLIAEAAGVGNIANLLMVGPDKLTKMIAQLRKYTGSVDTKDAIALQWQLMMIHLRLSQINDKIFAKVGPILERLGTKFANWLDSVDWDKVVARIQAFLDKVNDVVQSLGGWKRVGEALAAVLGLKLAANLLGLVGLMAKFVGGASAMTGALSSLAWGAGLVGAAFAGWKIGQIIDDNLSQATKDKIGQFTAMLMALAGSTEAQKAIETTDTNAKIAAAMADPSIAQNVKAAAVGKTSLSDPAVIRLLSAYAEAQAKAHGQHLGQVELGHTWYGEQYDPHHSRQFGGNNASLFKVLEDRYGLPAGTLERKFEVESAKGTRLVSPAGALGPMQIMPGTAKDMGLTYSLSGNIMDLDASAEAAAAYLAKLHKQFGSWDMAQAAYNWGPANLKKDIAAHGDRWLEFAPSETQKYVAMHRMLQSALPSSRYAQGRQSGANTNTVSIGTLNVNAPKATDAKGVAKGMQSAMVSHPLIGANVAGLA